MDHFNSESARPGTLASGDALTVTEIVMSIVPALVGMAVVGLIAVLMLL